MSSSVESTPNLAAAQFLPPRAQRRLDRLVSRVARRNRGLQTALQTARQAARADQAAYDAWIVSQAPQFDLDIPW